MQSRTVYSSIQALLAFVGTADAGTLYWAHRSNIELPCTTGSGCDLVYASHWSHVELFHAAIPLAVIGLAAYIVFLFSAVIKLTSDSDRLNWTLHGLIFAGTFAGTVFSWYLQYVSAVFIGAFCIYCRTSAVVMTLLFIISFVEFLTGLKIRVSSSGVVPESK